MASEGLRIPDGLQLVTASGVCSFCDYRFRDEQVLAYESSAFPGGVGYIEVRHLRDTDFDELWGPPTTAPARVAGSGLST